MNQEKSKILIKKILSKIKFPINDPSHDISHTQRVLNMAITIALEEKADLEIIIPAAIGHDAVVFRKDDKRNKDATKLSADLIKDILEQIPNYPKQKISQVMRCVVECSYSKGTFPGSLESKILQDADRLEATGAIAIMRTFSSGGQMERPFYNPKDPFREESDPTGVNFSLDLFFKRLYLVSEGMHTKTARTIAMRRHEFLKQFEAELRLELSESGVYGLRR